MATVTLSVCLSVRPSRQHNPGFGMMGGAPADPCPIPGAEGEGGVAGGEAEGSTMPADITKEATEAMATGTVGTLDTVTLSQTAMATTILHRRTACWSLK
ncbi:hypothetical protein ANANG_G00031000 [Anguilla anguilla]|uniref:Uncharacterized protein n=1 Tax=Anguilla anguilla TaxID=7936 RepID=A0A9D3MVV9_ANGAN|nr:hypothetical protein ANANG_G00031000 [Anguilla anguilla]